MSAIGLRKRILGGIGAQAFTQIMQTFCRLAEVPAFLLIWDAHRYGVWLLVTAIPTYLALADGGFATTAGREMMIRLSAGDHAGARRVFQSAWVLLACVSSIAMLAITTVLFAPPIADRLIPTAYNITDVKVALLILSAYILAGFLTGLYYGLFSAVQRYALGAWISASFYPVDLLLSLAGAWIFGSLTAAACGLLTSRMMLIITDWFVLRRIAPWCQLGFQHASRDVLKTLTLPALGSFAIPLGMAGNISGMRILVGAVLGPAAVPLFSSIRTLARSAQMPTLFIIRILEPELAIAYGQGRLDVFRTLLRHSAQIATWSGLAVAMVVLVVGHVLFPVWVHHRYDLDVPTLLLLLGASALNGIWYTMLQAAYATNRTHTIAVPFVLIYGLLCLLLGWLLMTWIGIAGAGLSLLIVESAMCALTIPRALHLSEETGGNLLATMMKPPTIKMFQKLRENH